MPRKVDGKFEEKKFARRRGYQRQPASGALKPPSLKGDVKDDEVCIDLKTTAAKQYIVKLNDMKKITNEALGMNKIPCLAIRFAETGDEYAVIRMDDFQALMEE